MGGRLMLLLQVYYPAQIEENPHFMYNNVMPQEEDIDTDRALRLARSPECIKAASPGKQEALV